MSVAADRADPAHEAQLVTFSVAGKRFGIDIGLVADVFQIQEITPVPLAPPGVVGIANLRGKVVTMLSLRGVLGLTGAEPERDRRLAVGVADGAEICGFMIDRVGDVVAVDLAAREPPPPYLRDRWSRYARAIHKSDEGLLVELDPEKLTRLDEDARAA